MNVNAEILVTILAVTMSFTLLGLQFLATSYTPRILGRYLKDKGVLGFVVLYVGLITFSMLAVTFPEIFQGIIHLGVLIQYVFLGTIYSLIYLICFIYYTIKKIQPEEIISDTVKNIQDNDWEVIVKYKGVLDSTENKFKPFIILEQTLLKSVINNDIVSFDKGMKEMGIFLKNWLKQIEDETSDKIKEKENEIKDMGVKIDEIEEKNKKIDIENLDKELKKLKSESEKLNKELKELKLHSEYIYDFFFGRFSQLFTECKIHHRERFIITYQKLLFDQMIEMYDEKKYECTNIIIIENFWDELEHIGKKIIELEMISASDFFIENMEKLIKKEFEMILAIEPNIEDRYLNIFLDRIFENKNKINTEENQSSNNVSIDKKIVEIYEYISKSLAYDQLDTLKDFGVDAASNKSDKLVRGIFEILKKLLSESIMLSFNVNRRVLSGKTIDHIDEIHKKMMDKNMKYFLPPDYFENAIKYMDTNWEKQRNEQVEKDGEKGRKKDREIRIEEEWKKDRKILIKKICKIVVDSVRYKLYGRIDTLLDWSIYFARKYPYLVIIILDELEKTHEILSKEKDSEVRDRWSGRIIKHLKSEGDWNKKHFQEITDKVSSVLESIDKSS